MYLLSIEKYRQCNNVNIVLVCISAPKLTSSSLGCISSLSTHTRYLCWSHNITSLLPWNSITLYIGRCGLSVPSVSSTTSSYAIKWNIITWVSHDHKFCLACWVNIHGSGLDLPTPPPTKSTKHNMQWNWQLQVHSWSTSSFTQISLKISRTDKFGRGTTIDQMSDDLSPLEAMFIHLLQVA